MDGILIINKSAGPTSHDVVDCIRKITGIRKVGHAGTLDPFAEGVLIILIGKATKSQSKFMEMDKTYIGTLKLGETTDTYDTTGVKSKTQNPRLRSPSFGGQAKFKINENKIQKTLKTFIGEIKQIPPIYSAIKIKGETAYKLARRGIKPKLKPRKVKIYNIKILNYKWPRLKIEVKCGKGTYIRSLAHDIGKKLGCGAYLEKLIRTKIGKFNIKNSIKLERLNSQSLPKKILSDNI
ncbi:MAG: tRNA pseudouridine(55) synthase TruB [bacterium]|nr:tRNA pseudouridine(55) synthase TruB [bacterium]